MSGFLRACSRGQLEIVQMLHKYSIASKDNVRISILQYYLHHCPIPISMQCGCNAAHYAADGGHFGVLCFLSEVGFKDFDQQSRVMRCCSLVFDVYYFSFCWEVWSIVTMHVLLFLQRGRTPLHFACKGGHTMSIRYLLTLHGADATLQDRVYIYICNQWGISHYNVII